MGMSWSDAVPFTMPNTTRRIVTSTTPVAGEWAIDVALPSGPLAGDGPWPAVYVVDPIGTFATAAHVAGVTTMLGMGAMRPVAVIGVGPHTDDFLQVMVQRNRDLTPTEHEPEQIAGMTAMGTGGGGAFLALLADVIEVLEGELPLDPSDRCLGGWSLGGLFTCFALATRPELFRHYIAVSPSLWWDDRWLLGGDGVERAPMGGCSVYLAVGEHEHAGGWDLSWPPIPESLRALAAGIDMVADLAELAKRLRDRNDVIVVDEVIAAENHSTVWPAAVTRAFVALYGRQNTS